MAHNIIPDITAEVLPYGILSPASTVIDTNDGAWETTLQYTDYTCNTETTIEGICIPGLEDTVIAVQKAGGTDHVYDYRPFSIETEFKCSTLGMTLEEIEKKAKEALKACRQKAIEYEFSTGGLSKKITEVESKIKNPYLSDGTAEDITQGTAVSPRTGLALLEQAMADCGCGTKGTIHGNMLASSFLSKYYKVTNDHLETKVGNYAIAGAGYGGLSPDGEKPSGATETYLYGTGPVVVVLGKINVYPADSTRKYEAVDIKTNTISYTASQTAAVITGGCCKSAVLIDINK